MDSDQLHAEWIAAIKRRNTLEDRYRRGELAAAKVKSHLRRRKAALEDAEKAARAIESEILTGESPYPLFAAAAARNGLPPPARPPDPEIAAMPVIATNLGADGEPMPAADLPAATSPVRGPGGRFAGRAEPIGRPPTQPAPAAEECLPDGCSVCGDLTLPPWTSDDLLAELRHALSDPLVIAVAPWKPLKADGATNGEILDQLKRHWPHSGRRFVPPGAGRGCSGGKLGYTITAEGGVPRFWLGAYKRQKPTLEGAALVDRVRRAVGIPTPSEARTAASVGLVAVGPWPPAPDPDPPPPKKPRRKKEPAHAAT